MRSGGTNSDRTGTSQGTRSAATPVSPASSAIKMKQPDKIEVPDKEKAKPPSSINVAREASSDRSDAPLAGGMDPIDDHIAEAIEIERMFHLKIMGLRRLPRYQRAGALRAAREERQLALNALKEKRLRERHARHALRQRRQQQQWPAPS
jgi:hypothetical protein